MVVVLFFTVVFNIVFWLYLHMVSKCQLQVGMTRPTAPRFFVTANAANAFLKRSNVALIVAFMEFYTFYVSISVSYSMKFISCESDRPVCKDVWIHRVWWEDSWYNSSAPLSSQCEVRNHTFLIVFAGTFGCLVSCNHRGRLSRFFAILRTGYVGRFSEVCWTSVAL